MRPRALHLFLAAALGVPLSVARAQDAGETVVPADEEGPIVVGERTDVWQGFHIVQLDTAIEFESRYREDQIRTSGEPDERDTEVRLREMFELSGRAFVGHQNLLDLTGTVRLGLDDWWFENTALGTDDRTTDVTHAFDVNAHVLGASAVPFDVYARREEQTLDREFAPSVTNTTLDYGALATYATDSSISTFRLSREETDQSDVIGQQNFGKRQTTFALVSNLRLTDDNRLEINYTFDDITDRQSDFFVNEYQKHDLLITDTQAFGDESQHELRSYLRYFDQSGIFGQETLRLDEQLRLSHSKTLETRYNFAAEQQSREDTRQDLVRGSATVRHELFDSLVSTGTVGAQHLYSSDDFSTDDYFFSGALDYTKKVPGGRLDAGVGASFNYQDNSERGGSARIFDERYVYNAPFPISISRRNIERGSLVVKAASGFPFFFEGVDFTVAYFSDRVEIRPILGGAISDGSAVLVDYTIGPEPSSEIQSIGTTFTIRYTLTETWLAGLSAYARCRTRSFDLQTAVPDRFALDDTRDILYGLEYERGDLDLRAEQEFHYSDFSPYDTTRFQLEYDHRFGTRSSISVDATHERIEYEDPSNQVLFSRLGVTWSQELSQEFSFDLRVILRDEQDELNGNSRGVDQVLGFRWRKRQTTISGSIKNTFVEADTTDTDSVFLELLIRREF